MLEAASRPQVGSTGGAGQGGTGGVAGTGGAGGTNAGETGGSGGPGRGGGGSGTGGAGGSGEDSSIGSDAADASVAVDVRSDGADVGTDVSATDVLVQDRDAPAVGTDALDAATDVPDAAIRDADATAGDAADVTDAADAADARETEAGGTIGPETLRMNGIAVAPDAGAPFDSRCAANEVVTGFNVRRGASTDAIGSICSKYTGGTLSSPRNLPLQGHPTGGASEAHPCPANYVAIGVVGKYGYDPMWDENVLIHVGVVCRSLANPQTTVVEYVTSQPSVSGLTSFREECTSARVLTSMTGVLGSNYFGLGVHRLGGECNAR